LSVSKKGDDLMLALDEKSKQILMCLLRERHAGIRELSNLISAPSDMQVLIRIKEVINPKAQEVVGKPAIKFERAKIDSLTGEKIFFNWWVNQEFAGTFCEEYPVEIMDEESLLRIVASIPAREENVEVTVADSQLIISGERYYREVPLSCSVGKASDKTLRNGVLEIKLNKVR
jgi:HSP20 family molecular chaperone IbpA